MNKFILAAVGFTLVSGAAIAQTSGPIGQQDTNKPGMANPSSTDMNKGATTGGKTTGTSTGMTKDGTSNTMNRGAESKDGDGMPKGGMKKN